MPSSSTVAATSSAACLEAEQKSMTFQQVKEKQKANWEKH